MMQIQGEFVSTITGFFFFLKPYSLVWAEAEKMHVSFNYSLYARSRRALRAVRLFSILLSLLGDPSVAYSSHFRSLEHEMLVT